MRVHLSPLAQSDLIEIRDHIARDKPLAAARLVLAIRERIQATIAAFPDMGESCDELIPGLRRFTIGNYVVFYR